MKIIVATDSFKDSLPSTQATSIIADAVKSQIPGCIIESRPIADGGEGTAKILIENCNGKWIEKTVTGPLHEMTVTAGFGWLPDKTAVIEMASASGLQILDKDKRNPVHTTTFGTGLLIKAAADFGARKILLAVGGSATVDCGIGAASAAGWRFCDKTGNDVKTTGGNLNRITEIIPPDKKFNIPVEVLCDVTNPLNGPNGAARIFAPQKGASQQQVDILEQGLIHITKLIHSKFGKNISDIPGAGAAGGLAAGASFFFNASLVSGIDRIIKLIDLDSHLMDADWIITGEGCLDDQSLNGKTVSGIIKSAKTAGVKIAVIAGRVRLADEQIKEAGISIALECKPSKMTVASAVENADALLHETAVRFAQKLK